ncbi:putative protein kinase [Leptomonas seymouri]|uniref:Protein kinase n=1 Tax=Leptomonas seymouri TaxID=5684 RepID=A0A0N1I032_LEPSE|nr:putative protein kinase [Leptomonas seymouri]|eukprot:KPI83905.1 putative protein kinase [Leptomonas seymouri]
MDSSGRQTAKAPAASPTGGRRQGGLLATEVPQIVCPDAGAALPFSVHNNSNASSATSPVGTARRAIGQALPPMPVPVATRLSPVNCTVVSISEVPAYGPASTTSSASPVAAPCPSAAAVATTTPHASNTGSLITTSQSGEMSGAEDSAAVAEPELEPLLTNGSIALAEFTSLLKPAENTSVLREHIIHLLRDVDAEDTLVRIARTLETQQSDAHFPAAAGSAAWSEPPIMTSVMANASQSIGSSVSLSARHSRRSSAISRPDAINFESLAGFSFLHSHRRPTDTHDFSSSQQPSEDATVHNRSIRGLGTTMDVSSSSQSSHPPQGPDSRRMSERKSRDDVSMSLTATRTSQLSDSTAALRVDPLKREVPLLPSAVRSEGRRVAVSAAPCGVPPSLLESTGSVNVAELVQPPSPLRVIAKTQAEEQQLRRLLRRCHTFASLEANVLEDVVKAMEREVHAAGTAILEQGQDSSEKMYLVGEGACEAIKNGKSMGSLQPGGTFGELELMYKQAKCAATIRCVTRCVLYSLDETSYHRAVMANSLQKRKKFENLTLNVPFLRCMPDFERMKVAEALVTREYRRGQSIIKFGVSGTYMHFIMEGEVKVVGRNNGRRVEVVRLHAGDVVGELEFLFNHLTVADVIVTSHRVTTACISRDHFELIIGPVQDRLKEFVATSPSYRGYYLSDVADESVRSELSRIESARKHRRVDSKENTMTLEDINAHGEVLLSAPLALLYGEGKSGPDGSTFKRADGKSATDTLTPANEALSSNTRDAARMSKALLRFPFAPVVGKGVAVLAMREDGLITYWNSVLEKLTSYTAEEVVGQNIYSFLLTEREQHSMLKAITTARDFAGDVEAFLQRPSTKPSHFTLARSDGLTNATVQLTVVPPVVSAGSDAAEVVLAFGEEVKQGPQKMLEQPQWLSAQIRAILADGTQTFEDRLEAIAETLNNFESTYRAMTVSTERLRVVNIRQMVGHVLMDFGSKFVTRNVSVRQRFEGLPSERAYLDADLLPECLRYAMQLCLKFSLIGGVVTIMITVTEKNGLEFLIINFNLAGDGLPENFGKFFDAPFGQRGSSMEDETSGDDEDEEEESNLGSDNTTPRRGLPPRLRRKLRRVQRAVEEQGGTLRIQRNPDDANIVFLIPFMPASEQDVENASLEESLHALMESSCKSTSLSTAPGVAAARAATFSGTNLLPSGHSDEVGSVSAPATPGDESGVLNASSALNQPNFSFTTCLAEDTPAHRIMLSSFLWERRHGVLTAFKFEDIVKLFSVADILIIDLQQSVIASLNDDDPISRLREMLRHMAVIITSTSFDLVSSDTYEVAGFITLKKPCTPVQAMKAIRRAEEKSAVVKLERIRIEQTRETLARNSRGAWRRGALLGKGSFGEVYEAFDVLTGGKMAVKEIRLSGNDAKIEQFVQEISTMCNLQHPNIIHYFYCEESKQQKVLRVFMEFAGGGTLQSLLKKKGKLEFMELRALLRDVVEGLAYIHAQHYVHCDIKTANVLLSADGKGKIGDFGTAHTVREKELLYVMQGSPLYMSPECMAAGEEDEDGNRIGYSFPSDIWSLGCVAMEMATTKPPFSHIKNMKGPAGLTNYITSLTDVPDLSPLFKCEPSVVEFVSACLNPDPSQRATAQELLQMSLFSESTHSDRNSAVTALKRAQLLHVLNKFVAFQEPEVADELERRRNRFLVRQRSSDFFSSSHSGRVSASSSSSSSFSATATSLSLADAAKREKPIVSGKSKSATLSDNSGSKHPGTAVNSKYGVDADSWKLPRCGETVAHQGGGVTSTNADRTLAATAASGSASNTRRSKKSCGDGSSTHKGEAAGAPFIPSLRKWHSSSSSSASSSSADRPTAPEEEETARGPCQPPMVGQASTPMSSTKPVPAVEATVVGADGLRTPLRHSHVDSNARAGDDEPDPRQPTSDDAYDLSPTPKQRSKTQSRPAAHPQERKRKEKEVPPTSKKQRRRKIRSSGSSTSSNSTEAAFFATSSSSSSSSCDKESNDDSRHAALSLKGDFGGVAGTAPVDHATLKSQKEVTAAVVAASLGTQQGNADPVKTVAAMNTGAAAVTPISIKPLSILAEQGSRISRNTATVSPGEHGSSSSAQRPNAAADHAPTFKGRRRNVMMDDEGNIVSFHHFTSSNSTSASPDSREAGTTSTRGLSTPKQGAAAATVSAAAPLHDVSSPLGGPGDRPSGQLMANTSHPLGSPGMEATFSAAPMVTNVSFMQPPNTSFYNYSFNKNISFMGANIDEVLSSAANDFLNSLAAANNFHNAHTNAPGSSSVFSVDTYSVPSLVTDRRGSTHSSHHDTDVHVDSVPMLSAVHAPCGPATSSSGHADRTAVHRETDSVRRQDGRSSSATAPAQHSKVDSTTLESRGEERSGSRSSSPHGSPLPQAPRFSAARQSSAGSSASTGDTEMSSASLRTNVVPLVGANASMARRPPLSRPPITNQSFFVVENHSIPQLLNGSMAFSSSPYFALGSTGIASSVTGTNAAMSAAPVSAITPSNAVAGGSGGGSAVGETPSYFAGHNPNVAVVAPPPLLSAFAPSVAARDTLRHRRRFGNGNSIILGSSNTARSSSNVNSRYTPSHGGGTASASGAVVSPILTDDTLCDDATLSSAAFNSVRSASSRHSSMQEDAPYLTAERLQQVAGPTSLRSSSAFSPTHCERFSSDGHSTALFRSLTAHDEAPLIAYIKHINQSLIEVAVQLQARRRRNSDTTLDSTASLDPIISSSTVAQQRQHPLLSMKRPHSITSPQQTQSPVLSVTTFPPLHSSAPATPIVECSSGATGQRSGSGLWRPSLPRPVSSCLGLPAASMARATRSAPLLGSQMSRSNPLWPADDDNLNSNDKSDFSSSQQPSHDASSPSASHAAQPAANLLVQNVAQPHSNSSDGEGVANHGNTRDARIEELLQKMLERVNRLVEHIAHLPQQPQPSHPAVAASTLTPAAVPRAADGAALRRQ